MFFLCFFFTITLMKYAGKVGLRTIYYDKQEKVPNLRNSRIW